jgi:hypothetical protein
MAEFFFNKYPIYEQVDISVKFYMAYFTKKD